MRVIVGLGNPGNKYSKTRHNIGFRVVDLLSARWGIAVEKTDMYLIGRGNIEGRGVTLLKPLTFMNRSGLAVRKVLKAMDIISDNLSESLIVIHDDIDIDTGIIRIRRRGSSGGHRGIDSIIREVGKEDFIRVKVGIGRDREVPVEEYVLSNFGVSDKNVIKDAAINAANAVTAIINNGVEMAMGEYNRLNRKQEVTKGL